MPNISKILNSSNNSQSSSIMISENIQKMGSISKSHVQRFKDRESKSKIDCIMISIQH